MAITPEDITKIIAISNDTMKKDIKTIITADRKLQRTYYDGKFAVVDTKLNNIINHNTKQNGAISEHTKDIGELMVSQLTTANFQANCEPQRFTWFIRKRWYLIILAILVLFFVAEYVYHDNTWFDTMMKFLNLR